MTTHLHILQLEEYDPFRFLSWWIRNLFVFKLDGKKPLVWTPKAKFIYALSFGFWPLMFLALLILKPYEIINRRVLKNKMRNKILELKKHGLKVIAISGSYGKTSVKEYLYQILKTKYRVLRTPGNYNTLFGVAKVADWELDANYDYFICEMGSYKIGETQELCETYLPDYAMLTGINEQHLERFGSLENEIIGESESVEFVLENKGQAVVNLGNKYIFQKYPNVAGYGQKNYTHPRDQNLEGAAKMASLLGVHKLPKLLKEPTHRLSLISRGDMTIIDDAYSSNTDGFAAAVKYLESFSEWKVIVTPGIPELGSATYAIHKKLGEQLVGLDQVILVGKNDRTRGLADGYNGQVIYIDKVTDAIGKVRSGKSVVLFENDLPDNY
ncbi:MAG: Mur ligase family protein [Candidatus Amesbacteria bacterium]|nr:Mur ligase family protein [Candidatus Amesbacteria bacterium]